MTVPRYTLTNGKWKRTGSSELTREDLGTLYDCLIHDDAVPCNPDYVDDAPEFSVWMSPMATLQLTLLGGQANHSPEFYERLIKALPQNQGRKMGRFIRKCRRIIKTLS